MTGREFHALKNVHDAALRRWAIDRAMFANANFRKPEEVAFIPEDFMYPGSRERRAAEALQDRIGVIQANQSLAKIKPGCDVEGIPEWARGEYVGAAVPVQRQIPASVERGAEVKRGLQVMEQ